MEVERVRVKRPEVVSVLALTGGRLMLGMAAAGRGGSCGKVDGVAVAAEALAEVAMASSVKWAGVVVWALVRTLDELAVGGCGD